MPTRHRWVLTLLISLSAGFGIFVLATSLVEVNTVSPVSDVGGVVLAFIQLVALFFPALAIVLQVLLNYSYRKADQQGRSGGVGFLGPDEFRWWLILVGGISSILLIVGLVALTAALNLPPTIAAGATVIILGIITIPIALVYVSFLEYRDM